MQLQLNPSSDVKKEEVHMKPLLNSMLVTTSGMLKSRGTTTSCTQLNGRELAIFL